MAKNINSLQLLRNTKQLYADKDAAISGITGSPTNDGTIKLARYQDNGKVKTIFGIYSIGSEISGSSVTGGSYTIYDSPHEVITALEDRINANKTAIATLNGVDTVEGSVAKKIKDAIEGLDVSDTAVTGSYVSAVNETDGKIKVERVALPTVAEIKSEGKAIISVKEDKGVISATAGDIAAAHVTIADAANHFTANTVEAALEELYSQAGAGSKVTVEEAAGTEEGGVLKVYTIKQGGAEVGKINIPKDLVVKSGSVVKGNWVDGVFTESEAGTGTALKLVIANQTAPVYINTLDLVKDHTAGNGIAISDTNVVSVKRDSTSEGFLTVGADGVKLSGVQNAIDKAAAKATTKVEKATDATHITLSSATAPDGSVTYTIGQDDIASATLLGNTGDTLGSTTAFGYIAKEVANREAAIKTEETARKTEDAKIVSGLGFSTGDTNYLIAKNTGAGESLSAGPYTVKEAIYTLDNALAAAKKANTLVAGDKTVVVEKVASGDYEGNTSVKVNIASNTNDSHKFVTFDDANKTFYFTEAILDAGTY